MARKRTVLLIGSDPDYLLNFRGELITRLVATGYRVVTAAWQGPSSVTGELERLGVARHVHLPIRQGSLNPLHEIRLLGALVRLTRTWRPEAVIAYTAKPVVSGMIASWTCAVPKRVALVEGLGYAFTEGRGMKRLAARLVLRTAYRVALRAASDVVVLNGDDRAEIARLLGIGEEGLHILPGIGVSERYFQARPKRGRPLRFLYVGRILIDKGLRELLEAARGLRDQGLDFRLKLVGPFDANPASLSEAEFSQAVAAAGADWVGPSSDIPAELRAADVLVLPSYREGFPRVVMEAMASGCAIITTDVPGCRDALTDSVMGLIVEPRSAAAIAAAMRRLLNNPDEVERMGAASQAHARAHFRADDRAAQLLDMVGLPAHAREQVPVR